MILCFDKIITQSHVSCLYFIMCDDDLESLTIGSNLNDIKTINVQL